MTAFRRLTDGPHAIVDRRPIAVPHPFGRRYRFADPCRTVSPHHRAVRFRPWLHLWLIFTRMRCFCEWAVNEVLVQHREIGRNRRLAVPKFVLSGLSDRGEGVRHWGYGEHELDFDRSLSFWSISDMHDFYR
jgi:hypothetical protein